MQRYIQKRRGIPLRDQVAAAGQARHSEFDRYNRNATAKIQKFSGNPSDIAIYAAWVRSLKDSGAIDEREADMLGKKFSSGTDAKAMFTKHLDDVAGREGGWWETMSGPGHSTSVPGYRV